jgi:hypothetical protein
MPQGKGLCATVFDEERHRTRGMDLWPELDSLDDPSALNAPKSHGTTPPPDDGEDPPKK